MAVTDYIFQEETVEKRNFGAWLVAKMVAAGWQQVGSNPPTAVADPPTKFYVMKTKRDADNAEAYVAINDYSLRQFSSTNSTLVNIDLLTDYTPGTVGASGTSSRSLGRVMTNTTGGISTFCLTGAFTSQISLDTLLTVRFCITKTHVTVFARLPSTLGLLPQLLFFGLPDFLQKEKVSGGSALLCSGSINTNNDNPFVCDTTPGIPSAGSMFEATGRWIDPQRSPDASGNFPLMPGFIGASDTGIRHRIPSFFFLKPGGVLDRDIIQVNGMNFEIVMTQNGLGNDFSQTNVFAYRIS